MRKKLMLLGILVIAFVMIAPPTLATKTETYHYHGKSAYLNGEVYGHTFYLWASEDYVYGFENGVYFEYYLDNIIEFTWSLDHVTLKLYTWQIYTFEWDTYGPTENDHYNFKYKDDSLQIHDVYNANYRYANALIYEEDGTQVGWGTGIVDHGIYNSMYKIF